MRCRRYLKSFLTDKVELILHRQCHGCWWPGFLYHKVINGYGIDLILLEHFGLSTRINNNGPKFRMWTWLWNDKPVGGTWHSESSSSSKFKWWVLQNSTTKQEQRHFVDISKHIQALLVCVIWHQWSPKVNQTGNQKAHFLTLKLHSSFYG